MPVIHRFTGGSSGWDKTRHPISTLFCTEQFHELFLKLCSFYWKTEINTTTNTHLMQDAPHCLTWVYRICTCFYLLMCRWAQRLLVHIRTVFIAFYTNTMKWDRFFYFLKFIYFGDNKNEPDWIDEHYDRECYMVPIFDELNAV